MTYYTEPDSELTNEEKLLAEVINMSQRLPCGFQIGMPMSELRRWKTHAEHGLAFSAACDVMMEKVIRVVGNTCQR